MYYRMKALTLLLWTNRLATFVSPFSLTDPSSLKLSHPHSALASAPSDSDFESPRVVSDKNRINPDKYNVSLDQAAKLWTASVQQEDNAKRQAGVPYLDSTSKNYFVDDLPSVKITRAGGLGMELLELAGGRDDGIGITIVQAVTAGGNAEKAGIIAGDSIAAVSVYETTTSASSDGIGVEEETKKRVTGCECRDFDSTIDALVNFPAEDNEKLYLDLRRIRRWPKVQVKVEYPPSQCAEGVDNVKMIELFAGENLKRALQNRGIILDDPGNVKCDYCGSNGCYVSISKGKSILSPMGPTEEKLFAANPTCRISCRTTVGYNMQEGDLSLRVNLKQWKK